MGINGEGKEIKESSDGLLKIIQSETTILKTNYFLTSVCPSYLGLLLIPSMIDSVGTERHCGNNPRRPLIAGCC